MKIANLYCGIGGNRKLWGDEHEITAVEINREIASMYRRFFPKDNLIIGDAHQFLLKNINNFDFFWLSPPCTSHSFLKEMGIKTGQYEICYPDVSLYQEIIILREFFKGKFVVENVKPYYEPLIRPNYIIGRHYYWSNFKIPPIEDTNGIDIQYANSNSSNYGFDLRGYSFETVRKDAMIRNLVNPEVGLAILEAAMGKKPKYRNNDDFLFDLNKS